MSEENKHLIHRWFEEVWNQGKSEVIDELLAPDAVVHGLADSTGAPVQGIDDFHRFHSQFRSAFSDLAVTVDEAIAEGDKVVARCSVHARHTGEGLGLEATNAPVEFDGIAIVRIRNGQIVEAWNNFDFLKMNRQLGIM